MDTLPSTVLLLLLFLGIHDSSSENLRRQKRDWIIDSFEIEEEYSGTFPYDLGVIELENKFTAVKLNGEGVDKDPKDVLRINPDSGMISVWRKVDYEKNRKLSLSFEAFDKLKNVIDTRLSVEVQILDVNDNVPTFTSSHYEVNLKESAAQGSYVIVVYATDNDSAITNNGTFDMRIVSVSPKPSGLEFSMNKYAQYGNMSFKGCLDYEKQKKYTVLVEVKDRGEKVQLSSTCTVIINVEDQNNHIPTFTGQTPQVTSVKERETNVEILRLQATDRDTKGTDAWMAKYVVHGKLADHFRIDTNPMTNEGILQLIKPLNYEDQSSVNLTISVENVGHYFSCKVLSKNGRNGLWDVARTSGHATPSTRVVIVNLEDVNDPPIFNPKNKMVRVYEDIAVGTLLEAMTAFDRDVRHGNQITYHKGNDSGGWVTVDNKTGVITTAATLDRESSLVNDSLYMVTVLAVDNGVPPLTGTGTLSILLKDRNDNVPQLTKSTFDMCIYDDKKRPSQANLTAIDLDLPPFAGPFRFELLGDTKDTWRINPKHGHSVHLVRKDLAYPGYHQLLLEVSDQQDHSTVHNISVHVCECELSSEANCRVRGLSKSVGAGGAIWILFFVMLLLLGILLLAFLMRCKQEIVTMPDEASQQHLIPSNSEHLGSDCKVALKAFHQEIEDKSNYQGAGPKIDWGSDVFIKKNTINVRDVTNLTSANTWNGRVKNSTLSNGVKWESENCFVQTNSIYYAAWEGRDYLEQQVFLLQFLEKRLWTLQAPEKELGDYEPHVYADEGHPDSSPLLDPIPIPEEPFHEDVLLQLSPSFSTLASLCLPATSPL